LTVDPARRLATALGLDLSDIADREVPLKGAEGSLSAAVIDSKQVFDGFIREHASDSDIVARIMRNRLYQQLSTTLSGSQEFTALERLLQALESGRYDLVILDTPPTKHAMDFLTAPERINALFQDSVTKWFLIPGEGATGFLANLVSRGTRMALKSLESLTGAQFIEELLDFFAAIRSIQNVLRDRSRSALALLTGEQTSFIVVTSFDAAKLQEAKFLQTELDRLGYRLRAVVINRAFPLGVPAEITSKPPEISGETYEKVLNFYKRFKDYNAFRYNLYEEFERGLKAGVSVVRVPEYQRDVHGLADLENLAQVLSGK
jgi:anion-transporting  ArsA/GET3 family ATPase